MRPILATISQSALQHNLSVVKKHAPHSKIMAVVKANGYGHGLINVACGLNAVDGFAVLGLNEAVDLREAGFEQTILLLEGVFQAQELSVAAIFDIDLVVHSVVQIEMLEQTKLAKPIGIHLKINTGMNRLGFAPTEFALAFNRLKSCQNVAEITLMTHFATADEALGIDAPLTLFHHTIKDVNQTKPLAMSLANSATILRHPQAHADWVRPGIMLYGASPVGGTSAITFGLKPVMQFSSEIISVQMLQAGDSVGYGNRYTARKPTRVGIVACGYADGYPRHAGQYAASGNQGEAPIAVAGKPTKVIGRVSMDMLFCDLTNIPQADIGAPVELWGNNVSVDAVAEAAGTVGYELLCAVAARVKVKMVD
ncbi:MAG: alanine racemase [Methylotenera sp.]|nr:alanine racemase [Methylotenera sp.]MDO9232347.1 alanine racemase [Methylotenera sp.]MDO9388023.1 alanine racemase [Methylotenera sp.]MDP2102123.1 alanine racemase [Methylotenera sp.]MDP2281083.1 alanine racemase [Methylotenera sp.]